MITNAGGINPTAAANAAIETARKLGVSGIKVATVVGDDLLTRLHALHSDAGQRFEHLDTGEPFDDFPGTPLFASAYLGAAPDRRSPRTRRRHRDHGSGRRRVALPRAPRARARLGLGRLGPAGRRHPRRSPAGVLRAEPRWQLLRRLVGAAASLGPAVPDRERRCRRSRGDLEAARAPGAGSRPTPCATNCCTRSTTRRATCRPTSWPTSPRRHFADLARRPRPNHRRARNSRDGHLQAPPLRARGLGGRGPRRVLVAGRVREGEGRPPRYSANGWSWRSSRSRSGSWSTGASTRWAVRRCHPPSHEPPECTLRVAWRCADQRTAGLVGRELVPLTLSAPPAGMTGAGRGSGTSATELLSIWPTLVDKSVVDAGVRVVLEEEHRQRCPATTSPGTFRRAGRPDRAGGLRRRGFGVHLAFFPHTRPTPGCRSSRVASSG